MSLRNLTAATSAALLAVTPLAVSAAPIERASAPTTEAADLRGGTEFLNAIIIMLIAAAGMAFLLLTDDDPASP